MRRYQLLPAVLRSTTFIHEAYVPLTHDGRTIGLVPKDRVKALEAYPDVFVSPVSSQVRLHPSLSTESLRTQAMQAVARHLCSTHVIAEQWKDEDYGARDDTDSVVFRIDRAAATFFGITQFGCHLNGFVRHGPAVDDVSVWMGLRHKSRSRWPERWDSIVGGGHPLDITPSDNMLKEAFEEAGLLSNDIAHLMHSVGALSYVNTEKEGLKNNTMFVFDLPMPPQMTPRIQGDEVDHFELWPIRKALELIESSPEIFKPDICLLLVDFAIRHGVLTADNTQHYARVARSLHATSPY